MSLSNEAIERGVALFQTLIEEQPELRRELEASIPVFFDGATPAAYGPGDGERLARRRHLEWFVFERPSDHLGGVPVEALMDTWIARSESVEEDHVEALLNSQAGVFEVTGVEEGRGLWMRDLLGLGEYPVDEPEAAAEFAKGDVVVGRVFPVGDSLYRLSPAVACFRNAELKDAFKHDMERLRASRHGSLRMAQPEVERMFHAPTAAFAAEREVPDPVARSARAREVLLDQGVPASTADRVLDELTAAASRADGGAVTDALNRLAFETQADLEVVRAELLAVWSALRGGGAGAAPVAPRRVASDEAVPSATVASALERFDEARRAGGDLDALFRVLEEDLEIEPAGDAEEAGELPDFPGVVGAMVEEFLWDTGREAGEESAARFAGLRRLSRFGESVGVFENLSGRDLLDFAGRWLLDEGDLSNADEARGVLDALAAFCRWSEERQDVPLWKDFGTTLEGLRASVPRLVEARKRLTGGPGDDAELYELVRDERGGDVLVDAANTRTKVELEEGLSARLRTGDLLLARIAATDDVRVSACYPAELAALKPTA